MKKDEKLPVMKQISGSLIIVLLLFISLTLCEKPDNIILKAQSDVKFPEVDPNQGNPDPTAPPDYLNPGLTYGIITDIEGNIYRTIQIGTQIWMAENLRTTKFNDGSNIRNGFFGLDLRKTGSYRWYEDDHDSYKNSYGALYNWYAVNSQKLCPSGWHVPGDDEWKQLEMELGMTLEEANSPGYIWDPWGWIYEVVNRGTDQGDKLKAIIFWHSDGCGTNASGFSAIPGGYKPFYLLDFYNFGLATYWWSSSELSGKEDPAITGEESFSISRGLFSAEPGVLRWPENKESALSVRCLKD